VKKSGD